LIFSLTNVIIVLPTTLDSVGHNNFDQKQMNVSF